MEKIIKQRINRALTMLKLTLVSNGCGLATDHEGHLFIFEDAELKKNGERLEKCDGIIVHLKDLVG